MTAVSYITFFSLADFIQVHLLEAFLSCWAAVAYFFSLTQDPAALKEEGNTLFKAGDVQGAVCCYTKALKLSDSQAESAVLYRNRSACYLKLEEYNKAEADASKGGVHYIVEFIDHWVQRRVAILA